MSSHHAITPPQHRQTGASRFNSSSTWLSQPILRASFEERVIWNSQRQQIRMMLIFRTSILNASINKYSAVKIRRDESLRVEPNSRTNVSVGKNKDIKHEIGSQPFWICYYPHRLVVIISNDPHFLLFTPAQAQTSAPLLLVITVFGFQIALFWNILPSQCRVSYKLYRGEHIENSFVTDEWWGSGGAGEMFLQTICIGALEADWSGPRPALSPAHSPHLICCLINTRLMEIVWCLGGRSQAGTQRVEQCWDNFHHSSLLGGKDEIHLVSCLRISSE